MRQRLRIAAAAADMQAVAAADEGNP
jgi:hypothetical protein